MSTKKFCDKCGAETRDAYTIEYSIVVTSGPFKDLRSAFSNKKKEFEVCADCVTEFNNFLENTFWKPFEKELARRLRMEFAANAKVGK